MYFKRIDLHGFKSFADPVSIEFHEGITCIVGPNGSGKSNISDAIRWVLGEQSPKMLRGGKMEEVIFAGTTNRKSRGMAEVTLVIDNTQGILPIDYAEVAITRRMYRSGESEYSINNNACRLRDIRELIMDTGIGVDGYSIIGQGKIAEIVSNKTESRREIFEEAAGIVKYRSKKSEAERKLAASQINLDRVNDIVGEIEARIDTLETDSKKATEYLALKERYKAIEINVTLKNIESFELKNEYLKDDLMELSGNIDGFKAEKQAVDQDIVGNKRRNEELDRLGLDTRDQLLKKVEEINSLVNQNQVNKEKRSAMEKEKTRLAEETELLKEKLAKESVNQAELLLSREKLLSSLESKTQLLKEKNQAVEGLSKEVDRFSYQAEENKNLIYELHAKINEKKTEKNSLENLQETLKRRKEQLLAESGISLESGADIKTALSEATLGLEDAKAVLSSLEEEGISARQKYARDVNREQMLTAALLDMRVSIGNLSTRKKMIEEMENAYEGYNHAVKFVMRREALTGIHGVVAELLSVPEGFETAMETALGASMQNIVCDDDKSAQAAILALKQNKAGRLTFLPLASMRPSHTNYDRSLRSAPGFCGFGVECIQFDEKYRNIMEYLLARVVIVDKLEHAIRLSKSTSGSFRFVTLEGEVINAGGAITGGIHRNNTSNLLERKTEAKNLGEQLLLLSEKQKGTETELVTLREHIKKAKTEMEEADFKYRELELKKLRRENEINQFNTQLAGLLEQKNRWQNELSRIEEEEKSSGNMMEELARQVALAEAENAEAEYAVHRDTLAYQEKKQLLEAAGEEITTLRLEAAAIESENGNLSRIMDRIQRYMEEVTLEYEAKTENFKKTEEQIVKMDTGKLDLGQETEQREGEKAELELYLTKIQEEKALVVRYLTEIEKKKESMEQVLFHYQNDKHELELKLAKNETQVESYKDKLWDEFEVSYIQAIEFKKREFVMGVALKESREIKGRMKELGEVNIGAIKEYETVKERYDFLSEQKTDLLMAMDTLKEIISDMDQTIRINFKESFDKIVMNFETAFQELFGGGSAELRLEDETKPLECGIEIIAQPPGKKLQNINLMSGGEKTMTAIALMFAVLRAKPTPFCILDEVEAALDEANIDRFANYLKNFHEIQFALVTHQKATMEFADVLYGVTMPEQGISKVISLRMGDEFAL